MSDAYTVFLAIRAVRAASLIEAWTRLVAGDVIPDGEKPRWEADIQHQRDAISDIEAKLPDKQLVAAYQRTDGEPGNPEADALAAELQRRNVDF